MPFDYSAMSKNQLYGNCIANFGTPKHQAECWVEGVYFLGFYGVKDACT